MSTGLSGLQLLQSYLSCAQPLMETVERMVPRLREQGATGAADDVSNFQHNFKELENQAARLQNKISAAASVRELYQQQKSALEACFDGCHRQLLEYGDNSLNENITKLQVNSSILALNFISKSVLLP